MKKKRAGVLSGIMTAVISVSVFAQMTGCAGNAGEVKEPAAEEVQVTPTVAETQPEPEVPEEKKKIDDNGKAIVDYDEFVNGAWLKEQEENSGHTVAGQNVDKELVKERIRDILENTDISSLPEDAGITRIISLYREMTDTDDLDERMKTIRAFLEPVNKLKSLEDLYKLYGREEYNVYDYVLSFQVKADENGYNVEHFKPFGNEENVVLTQKLIEDNDQPEIKEALLSYMSELGYSEERFAEIAENARKVNALIEKYNEVTGETDNFVYWDAEIAENKGISVPVFDILRGLNAFGRNEYFNAPPEMADLLNTMYKPENLNVIRDHYIYCIAMGLYSASGYQSVKAESEWDYGAYVQSFLTSVAVDVLAEEYKKKYPEEGAYESTEAIAEEVKNELMNIVADADWLGSNSKIALKAKVARMQYYIGSNGYLNEYDDLELSGNSIEDYLTISVLYHRFVHSQLKYEDDKRRPFNVDMLDRNGIYFGTMNSYVLTAATLMDPHCREDAAYEEKLGYVGFLLAHEMSHSLSPIAVYYDEHGYENLLMSDEEEEILKERADSVVKFFDGMELKDGKKIDGELIGTEAFTDLLGMQVCLNILSKKENADYDLFFRTYAKDKTYYYAEEDIENALKKDNHLPGKIRVNLIPAQFDVFYEVYDIDESSPYFVPADKRLKTY